MHDYILKGSILLINGTLSILFDKVSSWASLVLVQIPAGLSPILCAKQVGRSVRKYDQSVVDLTKFIQLTIFVHPFLRIRVKIFRFSVLKDASGVDFILLSHFRKVWLFDSVELYSGILLLLLQDVFSDKVGLLLVHAHLRLHQ